MTNKLATQDDMSVIESVVIGGDLSKLSPEQRVNYYRAVCDSLGLNPLTKPFDYITLNNRLTLYARKDCTDQLRNINAISIGQPDISFEDDWIIVSVVATDKTGRSDSDVGVVNKKDMQGNFGNALMKAVTKAKRRVTLSICGLGMLDETEVETIPSARPVVVVPETGEIVEAQIKELPANPLKAAAVSEAAKTNGDAPPTEKAMAEWAELVAQAEAKGISVAPLPENVTTEQLRGYYGEVRKQVKAA